MALLEIFDTVLLSLIVYLKGTGSTTELFGFYSPFYLGMHMKHRNQKNAEFHVEVDFLLKEASTFCFLSLCPTPL